MKLRDILIATTVFSAATVSIADHANANFFDTYERKVGTGDLYGKVQQKTASTVFPMRVTSSSDVLVTTKVFGKEGLLLQAGTMATSKREGVYEEFANSYLWLDGTQFGNTSYTCSTFNTCSDMSHSFEQALWSERKSFGVLPGVSLTVTGSVNASASFNAAANSYSGPGSLGSGNHKGRTSASLGASLDLSARLRGEIDAVVASVTLYGKLKIINLSGNMSARSNQDYVVNRDSTVDGWSTESTLASNTLSTGAGELGFEGEACVGCLLFPPLPIFASFRQKIASWGDAFSRTGELWNRSNSLTF